ncbi:hypothetical protein BDY19DRAFT_983330 [Irpex rosettiformis]|uniref:Uncharacterized protein n=1 Tax=Irpex rosettiformis TaxID=378272 RepID=A0ACB8UEI2_9APHY|nr:hypothetical protein BDY19DRAFT_983330 [Irpex rosettiformis]
MDLTIAPPWPSLYNLFDEIEPIENQPPILPNGHYLDDPNDVFRFTLYWTLIFYTPAYILCGTYAFVNLAFTPESRVRRLLHLAPPKHKYSAVPTNHKQDIPLKHIHKSSIPSHLHDNTHTTGTRASGRPRIRQNERRSRLTFAVLVLLGFAVCAVAGAVIGSAILGYVMAGVFAAANYHMSTWMPLFLALIQTLTGILGIWPSVVDVI